MKVDRDDSTYTGGKGTIFTLQSRDGLGSSSNIGNVNFDSYSNTFSLGGSVDGMNLYNGLNSAPSGGSASNSAYTYSGGTSIWFYMICDWETYLIFWLYI